MELLTSTVSAQYNGTVIRDYLKRAMGLSVTLIKRVKYGGVFINGENVHMRAIVREGDAVEVRISDTEHSDIKPIPMPLDIIYEDEYLIAVSKPRGMPTHPSRGNSLPTLAEGIMAYFGADFVFRAINRLDRDTGGIVVIAKDAHSAAKLSAGMKQGDYVKKYYAVVSGIPCPSEGRINAPIARECEGNIKRCVREDGKTAVTDYRVLSVNNGDALCEIMLHTGRTHQIRVHMAYIGHPLKNDFLYGVREGDEQYMLHAREMEIKHPVSGERLKLFSPADFE